MVSASDLGLVRLWPVHPRCALRQNTQLSQSVSLHPGVKMGTSKLLGDNLTKSWEVTCDGLISHPGGVEILLVASYYRNRR